MQKSSQSLAWGRGYMTQPLPLIPQRSDNCLYLTHCLLLFCFLVCHWCHNLLIEQLLFLITLIIRPWSSLSKVPLLITMKIKGAMATWCAPNVVERLCFYELAEPPKCHAHKNEEEVGEKKRSCLTGKVKEKRLSSKTKGKQVLLSYKAALTSFVCNKQREKVAQTFAAAGR